MKNDNVRNDNMNINDILKHQTTSSIIINKILYAKKSPHSIKQVHRLKATKY